MYFNSMPFDRACPVGNIASQLRPNPPDEETCFLCGELVEDCVCIEKTGEENPGDDR